jgi:hypothetical protein
MGVPPEYPGRTDLTPLSLLNIASLYQKHPLASVAISVVLLLLLFSLLLYFIYYYFSQLTINDKPGDKVSTLAAEASYCAADQGKYWPQSRYLSECLHFHA